MNKEQDAICKLSGTWPDVFLHVEKDGFHGAIHLGECVLKNSIAAEAFKLWSKGTQNGIYFELRAALVHCQELHRFGNYEGKNPIEIAKMIVEHVCYLYKNQIEEISHLRGEKAIIQLRWLDENCWKDIKIVTRLAADAELEKCRQDRILLKRQHVNVPDCEFRAVALL